MKNKHARRALLRTASVIGVVLFVIAAAAGGAEHAIEPPELLWKPDPLKMTHRKVMEILLKTYGATDWSLVIEHLQSHPDDAGNPNIMVIPLSLGNVHLNRYLASGSIAEYEEAFRYFQWVADSYDVWKMRWLTPSVVHYLVISVDRLRERCEGHSDLPRVSSRHKTPGWRKAQAALWKEVMLILKTETEYRLMAELPYAPHISCSTGDTKAEENAWEATLFAAAANFLADDPQAALWGEKARQLAYNSITRPSDPPDASGIKTCTVDEDLSLANHGFGPNPYYMAATLFLMSQGALTYRLTGRPIPEEFSHNLRELYEKYSSYLSSDLAWTVPADPEGDGTLFPLTFDSSVEEKAVKLKALRGFLWKPTKPVLVMSTGSELWEAVQNSKVVLYYLMGSYLWRFPSKSSGLEVCDTAIDGEVQ